MKCREFRGQLEWLRCTCSGVMDVIWLLADQVLILGWKCAAMDRTFTRLLASWLALEWYSLCVSGLLQRLAGIAQKGADKQDIHMYIKVYTQVPDMPTINILTPTHILCHTGPMNVVEVDTLTYLSCAHLQRLSACESAHSRARHTCWGWVGTCLHT